MPPDQRLLIAGLVLPLFIGLLVEVRRQVIHILGHLLCDPEGALLAGLDASDVCLALLAVWLGQGVVLHLRRRAAVQVHPEQAGAALKVCIRLRLAGVRVRPGVLHLLAQHVGGEVDVFAVRADLVHIPDVLQAAVHKFGHVDHPAQLLGVAAPLFPAGGQGQDHARRQQQGGGPYSVLFHGSSSSLI